MSIRQWFNAVFNVRRMNMATHLMAYRLSGALSRTMPWLKIERPLRQQPSSSQVGGRLGKRAPNADFWRSQKLRRYEKPLTNRTPKIDATQDAGKERLPMRVYRMDDKEPLNVRNALVSRWLNYRHLSGKR